jgi:hypothetical protein
LKIHRNVSYKVLKVVLNTVLEDLYQVLEDLPEDMGCLGRPPDRHPMS